MHSYNFFLFPSTLGVTDAELTLSTSSIQFLSHYGFDYNKVGSLCARNLEQRKSAITGEFSNNVCMLGVKSFLLMYEYIVWFITNGEKEQWFSEVPSSQ